MIAPFLGLCFFLVGTCIRSVAGLLPSRLPVPNRMMFVVASVSTCCYSMALYVPVRRTTVCSPTTTVIFSCVGQAGTRLLETNEF